MEGLFRKVFYATHPDLMKGASTDALREQFLVQDLFATDEVRLNYLHQERLIIGGAAPVTQAVSLPDLTQDQPFLARREMGIINVGQGVGRVTADGQDYELRPHDGLYIASETQDLQFESLFLSAPARFFLASTPAHVRHETRYLPLSASAPLNRGATETANRRTIHQLIVSETCPSAQLLMGLTLMEPGSVWNTMPPHLHDRRSEAYFYFGMGEDACVFHFMGQPHAMRHIVMRNEEAVICPPWSVHTGVGTQSYAFIWAMGGENTDYADMAAIDLSQMA